MVVVSTRLRCSARHSFILFSCRCAAPLLALFSWAVFTTAVAAQQPVGELEAVGMSANREGVPARTKINILSGSSIEAGLQTATLKLRRGGKLLVCPGTKLAIAASSDGRSLVFHLDKGNLELDYRLESVADTLSTPNLRLLMSGPGVLHQAVGVGSNGDTCVQALPANRTWVLVSEVKGDVVYQMQPDAAAEFKGGSIGGVVPTQRNCGCPSSPPNDIAPAASAGPGPTQPRAQPQPVVAKENVPVDTPSASLADASPWNPANVASGLPAEHRDSVSTAGQTRPRLTAAATSPPSHAPSAHRQPETAPVATQTDGAFTVQVGAFRVKDNAYRLADRLKNRQYPVEVSERKDSSNQLWYIVRVGRYANRSLAGSVADRLASKENLGVKPFICPM
jgi:cell division septation protein DedD